MSSRIVDSTEYLEYLASLRDNPRQAAKLISVACKDDIDCLSEIAYNVARGRVPLGPDEEHLLRGRYRPLVYHLIDTRVPWTDKRRELEQSGGFPPLLALLAPIIGSVVGGVAKNLVDKAMKK